MVFAINVWWLKISYSQKEKGDKMKDNFHIGFVIGMLTALFMAMVISCTMTPLEAGASELGSNSYNPLYVKIVE